MIDQFDLINIVHLWLELTFDSLPIISISLRCRSVGADATIKAANSEEPFE